MGLPRSAHWRYVPFSLPTMSEAWQCPVYGAVPVRYWIPELVKAPEPEPEARFLTFKVPDAHLLAYMPNKIPGAACYEIATDAEKRRADVDWQRWLDYFLSASIEAPQLSPEDFGTMGEDRKLITDTLLYYWNWLPDANGNYPGIPNDTLCTGLRIIAKRCGILPSQLLNQPMDAFVLDWKILQVLAAQEAAGLPDGAVVSMQGGSAPEEINPYNLGHLPKHMIEKVERPARG